MMYPVYWSEREQIKETGHKISKLDRVVLEIMVIIIIEVADTSS